MSRLDELRKKQSSTTIQPQRSKLDQLRANIEAEKTKGQMQQFKELTGMKTTIPTVENIQALKPIAGPPIPELPGRNLPVVGPILRATDILEANPVIRKIGEIGRELYTPGAGLGNVAKLTTGAENLV